MPNAAKRQCHAVVLEAGRIAGDLRLRATAEAIIMNREAFRPRPGAGAAPPFARRAPSPASASLYRLATRAGELHLGAAVKPFAGRRFPVENADAVVHVPCDELHAEADAQRGIPDEDGAGDADFAREGFEHRAQAVVKFRLRKPDLVFADVHDERGAGGNLRIRSERGEKRLSFALSRLPVRFQNDELTVCPIRDHREGRFGGARARTLRVSYLCYVADAVVWRSSVSRHDVDAAAQEEGDARDAETATFFASPDRRRRSRRPRIVG